MHEKGMERQDAALDEKLTETQRSVISSAANEGECGILRHNFARLCYKEASGNHDNTIKIISPEDLKYEVDHELNI